jgi:hypothetical protein
VEPRGLPKVASRLETEPRRFPALSSCGLCRSPCWDCATRSGNFLLSQCTRIIPCRSLNSQRIGGTTTTTTTTVPYHIVFSTSCAPQQHWESYVLFYHAWKVGQPGNCHSDSCSRCAKLTRKEHNGPVSPNASFNRCRPNFPRALYAGL